MGEECSNGLKLVGGDPTYWQLLNLVTHEPQVDPFGRVNFLVTGGWSVDVTARTILNEPRRHDDVDVIELRPTNINWEAYGVDNCYKLGNGLGGRPLNRRRLERTARSVPLRNSGHNIIVVNPAYQVVHRLQDYYDLPDVEGAEDKVFPRLPRDLQEGAVVLRARAQNEPNPSLWNEAFNDALNVLPLQRRRATRARIRDVQRGILKPTQRRLALAA